jgi:DNA-directed RNA polymerase specialized sigma24 family protein
VDTELTDVIRSPGTPLDRVTPAVPPSVTELFAEHHLALVRLALIMVGDLATAEDVVQDAFEQLHRRWRNLRKQSSALDYARSAVLNGCRSVLRRRMVARRHESRIAAPTPYGTDAVVAFEQRTELIDAFRSRPRCASAKAPSGPPPRAAWTHWPARCRRSREVCRPSKTCCAVSSSA